MRMFQAVLGVVSRMVLAGCVFCFTGACLGLVELYTGIFRSFWNEPGLFRAYRAFPGFARPYQGVLGFTEGSGYSTLEGSSFRDYWLP
jgi:hypothetical protein